jgi:diadenosine tetraphosphatase ApaH/serine/threonine PP2A family protein phosphatase
MAVPAARNETMRIALMADIHANREAFSACLDHASGHGIDRYLFLGDYVGYNADPGWAVDTVMAQAERGAIVLLGNHDAAALTGPEGMNENAAIAIEWTRNRLSRTQLDFLARLPLTHAEADRLYVHASADNPDDWHYVTDSYAASRSLAATRAQATFCGHVHVPMLYQAPAAGNIVGVEPIDCGEIPLSRDRRWLAVIGSVGQPRDHNPAACYAVLDDERNMLTYVRVPYDVERAAHKVLQAGLPSVLSRRLYTGD